MPCHLLGRLHLYLVYSNKPVYAKYEAVIWKTMCSARRARVSSLDRRLVSIYLSRNLRVSVSRGAYSIRYSLFSLYLTMSSLYALDS